MKLVLMYFLSSFVLLTCQGTKKTTVDQKLDPVMHFEMLEQDLGTVKKGETKEMDFVFTNTSKEKLVIDFIDSGCHCTEVPMPDKTSYAPGEKGIIKVIYFSEREDDLGAHEKSPLILLQRTDPITGSNMIREVRFKLNLIN